MVPRFDLVLSYWLFAWYLAFMSGLVPYNPKLFLILGLLVNTVQLFFVKDPTTFVFVNVFIKVVPVLSLLHTTTTRRDTGAGLVFVAVYLVWVLLNRESVFKQRTPLTDYVHKEITHK